MATKADFTEEEWKTMQKGVTGAGALVSISDPDFTDSFGEASAIGKYLAEQREKSDSVLIRDLTHVHGTGFGLTASREKVETETLEAHAYGHWLAAARDAERGGYHSDTFVGMVVSARKPEPGRAAIAR